MPIHLEGIKATVAVNIRWDICQNGLLIFRCEFIPIPAYPWFHWPAPAQCTLVLYSPWTFSIPNPRKHTLRHVYCGDEFMHHQSCYLHRGFRSLSRWIVSCGLLTVIFCLQYFGWGFPVPKRELRRYARSRSKPNISLSISLMILRDRSIEATKMAPSCIHRAKRAFSAPRRRYLVSIRSQRPHFILFVSSCWLAWCRMSHQYDTHRCTGEQSWSSSSLRMRIVSDYKNTCLADLLVPL